PAPAPLPRAPRTLPDRPRPADGRGGQASRAGAHPRGRGARTGPRHLLISGAASELWGKTAQCCLRRRGGGEPECLLSCPGPSWSPTSTYSLTVLMVVSSAVLVYFVVRTVRMRRNRKTRRYGVLDTNIENMELTPLEQDDEEDDNTLFDVNHPRR
ncbi:unnamed protein product, partial [Rangifer tarandus platyrhynchus]